MMPLLLSLSYKVKFVCMLKVAAKRIISGKWGCNNGQACVAPDYIITTKDFAPKLVRFPIFELMDTLSHIDVLIC